MQVPNYPGWPEAWPACGNCGLLYPPHAICIECGWPGQAAVVDDDGVLNEGIAELVEPSYGCECETCRCGSSPWEPECYCVREYHDPDCPDLTGESVMVVVPC